MTYRPSKVGLVQFTHLPPSTLGAILSVKQTGLSSAGLQAPINSI
jgi:hypothetical protein